MYKRIFLLFTFCFLLFTLLAQNNMQIQWQSCFGGSKNDEATGIVQTDNGYLIIGTTRSNDGNVSNFHGIYDIWVVSIDSLGNLLWEKTYGGSNIEIASNIINGSDGYYYFSGWTFSNDGDVQSGNHGGYDRWIVKIDSEGNIIWEQCYGGSMTEYGGMLKLLSNGNILSFGATFSCDGDVLINYGYLDIWLLEINTDGEILLSKVLGNNSGNNIYDIIETHDHGFFLVSETVNNNGMVDCNCYGGGDIWALKLDSLLNIEWQQCYGGSNLDYGYQGVLELDDGYIFLSSTNSNDFDVSGYHYISGENADIWAVRTDLTGNIIWQRCLGGSRRDYAVDLFQSEDGGFVIIAETDSYDGDVWNNNSIPTYNDIWMVKLSSEGEVVWSQCYGGNISEHIFNGGAVKKSDDNYIIAGITEYNSGDVNCNLHGETDIWIFEIKDCSQYMPQIPNKPNGPDTLCYTTDSTSKYEINTAAGAWGYEWQIEPEEAGTILQDTLSAYITWNQQYEGEVAVSARSFNDCGESDWSEEKLTWVYNCVGINEIKTGNVLLRVYPNPAKSSFEIRCSKFDIQKGVIEIYNTFGVKVKEIINPKGQIKAKVNTKGWAKGIYFVRVHSENGIYGSVKVLVN